MHVVFCSRVGKKVQLLITTATTTLHLGPAHHSKLQTHERAAKWTFQPNRPHKPWRHRTAFPHRSAISGFAFGLAADSSIKTPVDETTMKPPEAQMPQLSASPLCFEKLILGGTGRLWNGAAPTAEFVLNVLRGNGCDLTSDKITVVTSGSQNGQNGGAGGSSLRRRLQHSPGRNGGADTKTCPACEEAER